MRTAIDPTVIRLAFGQDGIRDDAKRFRLRGGTPETSDAPHLETLLFGVGSIELLGADGTSIAKRELRKNLSDPFAAALAKRIVAEARTALLDAIKGTFAKKALSALIRLSAPLGRFLFTRILSTCCGTVKPGKIADTVLLNILAIAFFPAIVPLVLFDRKNCARKMTVDAELPPISAHEKAEIAGRLVEIKEKERRSWRFS
jgi:hypothetical protein